ncbi:hypothetical protein [Campylobacter troglodytis]|nr:hypothetical protein [Campylobacter troglodytis]
MNDKIACHIKPQYLYLLQYMRYFGLCSQYDKAVFEILLALPSV